MRAPRGVCAPPRRYSSGLRRDRARSLRCCVCGGGGGGGGGSSSRSVSVRPSTAYLLAAYSPFAGTSRSAAPDTVFTTCPSFPRASMRGTKLRIPFTTPNRLMENTQFQSERLCSQVKPKGEPPALLQSRWQATSVSYTFEAACSTASPSVTSVTNASAFRPSSATAAALFSARSASMSTIATSIPARAAAMASAAPIPLPPPVTTATLSASSFTSQSVRETFRRAKPCRRYCRAVRSRSPRLPRGSARSPCAAGDRGRAPFFPLGRRTRSRSGEARRWA